MSLPIQGNQYFNRVENIASSQIQRVESDNVQTTNLTIGYSLTNGPNTSFTVTGYTPASFLSGGTVTTVGGVATGKTYYYTLADVYGNNIQLPLGATITSLIIVPGATITLGGTGTGGSATFNIGGNTLNVATFAGIGTNTTPLSLTAGSLTNLNAKLVWQNSGTTGSVGFSLTKPYLTLDVELLSNAITGETTTFVATAGLTVYCTYTVV